MVFVEGEHEAEIMQLNEMPKRQIPLTEEDLVAKMEHSYVSF